MAELLSVQVLMQDSHNDCTEPITQHVKIAVDSDQNSKTNGNCSNVAKCDLTSCAQEKCVHMSPRRTPTWPYDSHNLSSLPKRPAVNVEWKKLTYSVSEGYKRGHKTIINGISGEIVSGELTAIMGPSGAGKSTLMNILAGYIWKKVKGDILVNHHQRDLRSFRRLASYIMQYDFLLPQLTVEEALMVAANLKITTSVSASQKKSIVSDIILALGLHDCAKTRTSCLSGGQRKRLSIAQELVNNPPVIFLDEPTSGLDSSNCQQCITLLKALAREGRNVVCTIHQPSARIFENFDKLYMLAEGQCIYQGPVPSLLYFLSSQGLECPTYHNPADFVTEIASREYGDHIDKLVLASSKFKKKHCIQNSNSFSDSNRYFVKNPAIKPNEEESAQSESLLNDKVDISQPLRERGYPTSYFNQFWILLKRTFLSIIREPMYHHHPKCANGQSSMENLNVCGLMDMFPSQLVKEVELSEDDSYSDEDDDDGDTSATMDIYVLGLLLILFPLLYSSIVYWMTSQPSEAVRFLNFLVISILTSLVSQAFGLVIGAACNVQTAVFLAPVFVIPFLLFSGFFITFKTIPDYLRWLSYISYIRYAFEGLMLSIYGFGRPELECEEVFCPFVDPSDFLKFMDMNKVDLCSGIGSVNLPIQTTIWIFSPLSKISITNSTIQR
ncbi:ATP-binding cassette sub-family G member 4-like [Limulus polyphemus]|uniref:ATP-binding cassette sub-family G member 4-like n=1 Tax=Limulus polyphemus TaxID=6850 RepID=A0ABM1T7M8_LIMPO|nr:ATP-binding cassette sub-family G member 4-like [Limulus polyphemus]